MKVAVTVTGYGLLLGLAAIVPTSQTAAAQSRDTMQVIEVTPLTVTAERTRALLVNSTAAVSRIEGDALRNLPVRTVAEALQTIPGLVFVDTEGTGLAPQLMVRGFYGGGEAEYMVVLVDGRPVNGLESGLVAWDLIPLESIAAIEVVRGGASSLYGDAAVGGVINLITAAGENGSRVAVRAGQPGLWMGSASVAGQWNGGRIDGWAGARTSEGFREHARRRTFSAGGSATLFKSERTRLGASSVHHFRNHEEPGPLRSTDMLFSRTATHPFFRFDRSEERGHRFTLDLRREVSSAVEGTGFVTGEIRDVQSVRTLPLSPEFVDTKERAFTTARVLGSSQVRMVRRSRVPGAVLLGIDWSAGELESRHFGVLMGDSATYASAAGGRGDPDASGRAIRLAVGGFTRFEAQLDEAVRLTAGARLDWLRDDFKPRFPAGDPVRSTHVALSPQLGVNVRYLATATQHGSVFVTVGQSFKAPPPDQLFDQRTIPVPVEPYAVTLANHELDPQQGTSVEAGVYHSHSAGPGMVRALLSLSAYQIDMRDELDVDLQTFRYVNIGRSRHRGLDAGLRLSAPGSVAAFASYTMQDVTFRYGDNSGNALKAIPRHAFSAGLGHGGRNGFAVSVTTHGTWGIWLDDANTLALPGYVRLDGKVSYGIGGTRVELSGRNLLDARYSTTGYPDPAGSGTTYYYPAAGRTLTLSVTAAW